MSPALNKSTDGVFLDHVGSVGGFRRRKWMTPMSNIQELEGLEVAEEESPRGRSWELPHQREVSWALRGEALMWDQSITWKHCPPPLSFRQTPSCDLTCVGRTCTCQEGIVSGNTNSLGRSSGSECKSWAEVSGRYQNRFPAHGHILQGFPQKLLEEGNPRRKTRLPAGLSHFICFAVSKHLLSAIESTS